MWQMNAPRPSLLSSGILDFSTRRKRSRSDVRGGATPEVDSLFMVFESNGRNRFLKEVGLWLSRSITAVLATSRNIASTFWELAELARLMSRHFFELVKSRTC